MTSILENENTAITIKAGIFVLLALLQISADQVGYLLIAVFVDSFFGVLVSFKFQRPVRFKTFWIGITGKLSILVIPFMIAGFGMAFKHNLTYIVDMFIYGIAANETLAILAKIGSLGTSKEFKSYDMISKMIEALSRFFQNKIEKIIDSFNDKDKS